LQAGEVVVKSLVVDACDDKVDLGMHFIAAKSSGAPAISGSAQGGARKRDNE